MRGLSRLLRLTVPRGLWGPEHWLLHRLLCIVLLWLLLVWLRGHGQRKLRPLSIVLHRSVPLRMRGHELWLLCRVWLVLLWQVSVGLSWRQRRQLQNLSQLHLGHIPQRVLRYPLWDVCHVPHLQRRLVPDGLRREVVWQLRGVRRGLWRWELPAGLCWAVARVLQAVRAV